MPGRSSRLSTFMFVGAGVCLLSMVCGCAQAGGRRPDVPRSTVVSAVVKLDLSVPVYELTFDRSRDALWFASFNGGQGVLTEYSIKTGDVSTFPLPAYNGNGFMSHVRVAPDGAVWVTTDYAIDRVDPATSQTQSLSLAETVDGALPGALDPSSPLPGTWVSALAFDAGGRALVARNNVPFLQIIDSELELVGSIDIPPAVAGAADMTLETDGLHAIPGHANRTDASVATVALAGVAAPAEASPLRDSTGGPITMTVLEPDGSTIAYNIGTGQLQWTRPATTSEVVKFPQMTVPRNAPNGTLTEVPVTDEVTAAAIDATGTLWFVVAGSSKAQLNSA